jgi:hypothetical protein
MNSSPKRAEPTKTKYFRMCTYRTRLQIVTDKPSRSNLFRMRDLADRREDDARWK